MIEEKEHSLEMQFPFIKKSLNDDIKCVPLMIGLVGEQDIEKISAKLKPHFSDPKSVFIFSTDFCHWGRHYNYMPFADSESIYNDIEKLDLRGLDLIKAKNLK